MDAVTLALASRGTFNTHRWEDMRVTADVAQDGAIQGGPNPVREKGLFNSARGNSYSGLGVLNFKNLSDPFWQSCNFTSQLPHAWLAGSSIDPHLHFMLAEGNSEVTGKNMFDSAFLEAGNINVNNGGDGGSAVNNYRSQNYIHVISGNQYSVSYVGVQTTAPRIFWYDQSQAYISYGESAVGIEAPPNAVFARFRLNSTDTPTEIQFEHAETPTAYEAYGETPPVPAVGQKLLLEFEYVWVNISGVVTDTTIETINYTVTQDDIDGRHFLIPFSSISKSDGGSSSMIWGRFSRIRKDEDWAYPVIGGDTGLVNDDFEGDLYFLEWDYHYQIDKTGTSTSYPGLG